jgi:RNA polymerase sigma-70 factor (ECF subfamily)
LHNFDRVYEQEVTRVYGFFAYALHSLEDAEDLTQQTFERALRAWGRYDESRGEASTWLMTIARNLLIDHMRRRRAGSLEAAETLLEAQTSTPDRVTLGLDPQLERALLELGPRDRELIGLRFGADLTGAQIAALTGLSRTNVQQILSRSLRRMRASLDGATADARQHVPAR